MNRRNAVRYICAVTVLLGQTLCLPARAEEVSALPSSSTLRQWGKDALDAINRDFWLPNRKLYADKAKLNQAPQANNPAFTWGVGVQLTALASAAKHDPKRYGERLRVYTDAVEIYWANHAGIGGYDVLPLPKPVDRYYDDNIWLALALMEIFEITRDPKYLAKAEDTFRFALSGQDSVLGGGIYWRENEKTSKNTCSNAPAIVTALRLHELTRNPAHLETAYRLYHWTCARLQDSDGLFWDNIGLDGKIDRTKFSYNSALMIRANALFHALTSQSSYLKEAQRIARASESKWIVKSSGAVSDGGRFAHLLLESFLALYEQDHDPHWLQVVGKALAFLHDTGRDAKGHYPERWDAVPTKPSDEFELIAQSSAARAFWKAAEYEIRRK